MAVFSGPEIINSGLAVYYDANNTQKSWKGLPITNVISDPLPSSAWSVSNFNGSSATVAYETENNIRHLKITGVVLGTGNPDYPRITGASLSSTITDGFSVSFEAKGTPGEVIKLALYSAGSTKITLAATLTADWQRFTFNNQTTGFTLDQPYIRFDSTIANSVRYIRKIQVEQNTFASPFVAGTRSSAQAVLDLANNNTITATSLTYASNNTFSFNGTTNYLTLQDQAFPIQNTSYTIEAWIKRSTTGVAHGIIGDLQYDWQTFHVDASNKLVSLHRRLSDNIENTVTSVGTISTGWTHVVVVFDITAGKRLYINGVLDNTNSSTTEFQYILASRGPKYIGITNPGPFNTSARLFNGSIDVVKGYTRALSANEIRQNYEALKTRYGL